MFGDSLPRLTLKQVEEVMTNLVTTTYEAATAYLHEESKNVKGDRDLLREMCAIVFVDTPKDRKVYFMTSSAKLVIVNRKPWYSTFQGHYNTSHPFLFRFDTTFFLP